MKYLVFFAIRCASRLSPAASAALYFTSIAGAPQVIRVTILHKRNKFSEQVLAGWRGVGKALLVRQDIPGLSRCSCLFGPLVTFVSSPSSCAGVRLYSFGMSSFIVMPNKSGFAKPDILLQLRPGWSSYEFTSFEIRLRSIETPIDSSVTEVIISCFSREPGNT